MRSKLFSAGLFITIGLVSVISSCKKDKNNPSGTTVTSSIFGRVVDENGFGIYGATAQAGDKTATTDANGIFKINDVTLSKNHALVKVSKAGYFDGTRTFIATSSKTSTIQIRLLTKSLKASFSASSGATVTVTSSASIEFPANAIKNVDGSTYTGTVKVYAAFLDPTDSNLETKMPGDLIGTRTDNSESLLRSFGMMNVELEDASGNKLNIADGKEATLTMVVPASLLSAATSTIPLWYFDTNIGLWKEEGIATLTGNKYIGKVKHFSWWNCDTPAAAITLSLRLVDADGNPISNITTILKNISNNDSRIGVTDNDGKISGLVYSNAVLRLSFLDACGNLNLIQDIGPFSANTDLGNITVNLNTASIQHGTYTGKITNCAGGNVTNGYIKYTIGASEHYTIPDANGNFSFDITVCNTTPNITVTTFDIENLKQSTLQNITFTTGTSNLGSIAACGADLQEYLKISIDGGSFTNFTYVLFEGDSTSLIYASNNNDSSYFNMSTTQSISNIGIYAIESFYYTKYSNPFLSYSTNIPSGLNTIITNYASNIGEYYEGSFNGSFIDAQTSISHTINCSYRIKRVQ
ncbi:MAG: hypothetical protein KA174_02270 [Chitinophagales bacterium]|nr:hypothetical protein [Chitinophagales bacterium]